MTNLNPLRWKPEHWVILLLFIGAGALAGAVIGYFVGTTFDAQARPDFLVWIRDYSDDAWPWELTGAVLAGVVTFAIGVTSEDA